MAEVIHLRLRRSLSDPVAAPVWPDAVRLQTFSEDRARDVHGLLDLAYASGGGTVPPFDVWWPALSGDEEYDPDLCFIARDGDDRVVGVAQCWTTAFVKDLAVYPDWRRRGLGTALLLHAFGVFQARGATAIDLKVEADNPSGAVRLYERMEMRHVPS